MRVSEGEVRMRADLFEKPLRFYLGEIASVLLS
jgi:hypothetical protein